MNQLAQYAFVDCLFIAFDVDRRMNRIQLTMEAHFPMVPSADKREKGLITICFEDIRLFEAKFSSEFQLDLNWPYALGGDTVKANEIIKVNVVKTETGHFAIVLETDFMSLRAEAQYWSCSNPSSAHL